MKSFNIDWGDFVKKLDVWSRISIRARQSFFEAKPSPGIPTGLFPQADLELLESHHLLKRLTNGDSVRVDPLAAEFSKAMRAMSRHFLNLHSDERAMAGYGADHFTTEERAAMLHERSDRYYYSGSESYDLVLRESWIRQFLNLSDHKAARAWEQKRLAQNVGAQFADGSPYFSDAQLFRAAHALVESALTWREAVPLADLPRHVAGVEPALLWRAILPAVRYLLLFPRLDAESLIPVIGLWPRVTHLLNRPAAVPPGPVEPRETFGTPLLIHDMTTLLVAAAAEPIRVLADGGGLYAKEIDRLSGAILPAPDWLMPCFDKFNELLAGLPSLAPENRICKAVEYCQTLGLVQQFEGKYRRIENTRAGQDWLAMDPKRQLKQLLEPWRLAGKSLQKKRRPNKMIFGMDGAFSTMEPESNPWLPPGLRWEIGLKSAGEIDWRAAFADALATEAGEAFVPVIALLVYHSRVDNPLLGRRHKGSYGPTPRMEGYRRGLVDELSLENYWLDAMAGMIQDELLPLGAVELGRIEDEHALRLHSIGRYMLGLSDDFELEVGEEGSVIIQPNFDVTFLGPSPRAEAMLAPLAQRTGRGVGTLFHITRASILNAAAAGINAKQALDNLRAISSKPLPDNVQRMIGDWFNSTRQALLRHAWIVEAPDEETADRIFAMAGKAARRLAPTVLSIGPKKDHSTMIRKLKESGIFIRTGSFARFDD